MPARPNRDTSITHFRYFSPFLPALENMRNIVFFFFYIFNNHVCVIPSSHVATPKQTLPWPIWGLDQEFQKQFIRYKIKRHRPEIVAMEWNWNSNEVEKANIAPQKQQTWNAGWFWCITVSTVTFISGREADYDGK